MATIRKKRKEPVSVFQRDPGPWSRLLINWLATLAVIMAFGFRPHNMEWLAKHSVELDSQGRIIAPEGSDNAFQTSNPKIFAGGDIVRGSDLVVTAIAEGRKAADGIMNWLEV